MNMLSYCRNSNLNHDIEESISELNKNEKVKTILLKFIEQNDYSVFLSPDYLNKCDKVLGTSSLLFDIYEPVDLFFVEYRANASGKVLLYLYQMKDLVTLFVYRGYIKYELQGYFVCWELLKSLAAEFFAKKFKMEHFQDFNNIEEMTIDECIDIYKNNKFINVGLLENIALFSYFIIKYNKKMNGFENTYNYVHSKIDYHLKKVRMEQFESNLLGQGRILKDKITLEDVDLMSGQEFEQFIASLFEEWGYSVCLTKASGDQGIDIIATKNGYKIGIQTKCYSQKVTNKAVQEVVSGLAYYKLDKGMVITNHTFTKSALQLANSNNVVLWDRTILKEKI